MLGHQIATIDTGNKSTLAGSRGIHAIDASNQYSNSFSAEDAQGTTDTQSLSDDVAINQPDHGGGTLFTASFTSFDTNGWTLNFSNTDTGSARLFFALAIEEVSAGGLVNKDIEVKYDILNLVNKDIQAKWDILNSIRFLSLSLIT